MKTKIPKQCKHKEWGVRIREPNYPPYGRNMETGEIEQIGPQGYIQKICVDCGEIISSVEILNKK